MTPEKRRTWRNAVTGILAASGLSLAIAGVIGDILDLTSLVNPDLVDNAILAVLSALLLYLLLSSVYHEDSLDDLTRQVEAINRGKITRAHLETAILDRVDSKLRPMFCQHLRSVIDEIIGAYELQTVVFSDPHLFKAYYLAVLEAFPRRSTLIATSLPLRQYFWNGAIEDRMGQFIRRRGRRGVKFKRVFYVEREVFDDTRPLSQEQVDVMRRQLSVGVEIFIHPCGEYPKTLVLADDEGTIAWVVETNDDHTIRKVTATSKPSDVQIHFDRLQNVLAVAKPIVARDLDRVVAPSSVPHATATT